MSVNDHSRFAPSAFAITVPCPGSVQLQEAVPAQPDTEEIAEGKAAHHVAAEYLRGRPMPVGATFEWDGRKWIVDEDMADGAELWADEMGPGCTIEDAVHIPRVHADCWGTPDGWRLALDDKNMPARLRVGDYKYGHRYVDPFENLQVAAGYASGILSRLGISAGDDNLPVEIIIVQPRAFHRDGPVQRWVTTPFKLNELVKRVRVAVELAAGPNPPTQTGTQCKDCKARHVCGTLRASVGNVVDFAGTIEPVALDTVAAATELAILEDAAARLDSRRTGLLAQVESELRAGRHVPYYGLEPGQARLEWNDDVKVDEVIGLGTLMGQDLRKPPTTKNMLCTPTQAIERKKIDPKVIAEYATRKPAGVSVKRMKEQAARKIFGKG